MFKYQNTTEEGSETGKQGVLSNNLGHSNTTNEFQPAPKRIALPPVTYTTTSPRTRSKVRQTVKDLEQSGTSSATQKQSSERADGNQGVADSSNATNELEPLAKRVAIPPVTSTTTSPRTRSKVRQTLKELEESSDSTAQKQSSEKADIVQDEVAEEIRSPRTRQAERLKIMEEKKMEDQKKDDVDETNK